MAMLHLEDSFPKWYMAIQEQVLDNLPEKILINVDDIEWETNTVKRLNDTHNRKRRTTVYKDTQGKIFPNIADKITTKIFVGCASHFAQKGQYDHTTPNKDIIFSNKRFKSPKKFGEALRAIANELEHTLTETLKLKSNNALREEQLYDMIEHSLKTISCDTTSPNEPGPDLT